MTIAEGTVQRVTGGLVYARTPRVRIGAGVRIAGTFGRVEAFDGGIATIASFGSLDGIAVGTLVVTDARASELPLGTCALGRAINASGRPLDRGNAIEGLAVPIDLIAVAPEGRRTVEEIAWTGVRAIDGLLPFARGARMGIFGPPGTGKSSLTNALVRGMRADAAVVALVGERGREAEEWIRNCMPHTTIVCATSDRSASERVRAAEVAFAQAHTLRTRGLHVVLVLDSLARYANALREIAIATGESTGRGGYPPSVFARIARTLEIAGATKAGAITAIVTVLDDGDERDPVSDAARSLLDGHIALSPKLAHAGHFPAIDICASASRTLQAAAAAEHQRQARIVRDAIAYLQRTEEVRSLGIIPTGERTQLVLAAETEIQHFLRQNANRSAQATTLERLENLAKKLEPIATGV